MNAVTVENISKNYRIYSKPSARLKELIFRRRRFHQDFWALREVGFQVEQGATFGIVGRERLRQEHPAPDHRRNHDSDRGQRGSERSGGGPVGAWVRLQHRVHRPGERLSERRHHGD